MKLIYFTSKKFPSAKTDPFYVRSMAEAFSKILGEDFLFLVRDTAPNDLTGIPAMSIHFPKRFRLLCYFFGMPILIVRYRWNGRDTIFLSYDPYLLAILIFWRKIARFKYRICSDWHQLFDDWKDRYVAIGSDYLVTTSRKLKENLSSATGIAQEKILVAYGGVHADLFRRKAAVSREEYREKLKLPHGVFLVGYVGIFKSVGLEKGIDMMIKSLAHLDERIAMVFVGGSEQEIEDYGRLAEQEHVRNRCIFVKRQPFEKVVEYELAMDVLVIPYPDKHHFRNYGFPMKVWEYMASGRPIACSNLEIIREALEGKAVFFEPGNAADLARTINSIYQKKESAEEILRNNPRDVEVYTWKARAQNILKFMGI